MPILLEILIVAVLALAVARLLPEPWRGRLLNVLKAWVTARAFWLLLTHPVKLEDGSHVIAWRLIFDQVQGIELGTFLVFVLLAASIKFLGILASMYRWLVLLRGQGIELPFRHIFGSFLIGRFIGTFLPSTAGLDGYKLYDAARFSGRTVEVTATTALEKLLGVSGIFLSFLVALPFGIKIFGENAAVVAGLTVPLCLGVLGGLLLLLWYPALVQWLVTHLPIPGRRRLEGLVMRVARSAAAYRDKKPLALAALLLSFVVHFTTAAMYYFTALAIGATQAEFWPIAFGSSIQIFATVMSPFTIAGEGIREAAQYVLLGNLIGPAEAIVSAALGFWAAEALTLAGGFFWWLRPAHYHPAYCRVDGVQVDYEQAARAALELETEREREARHAAPVPEAPALLDRLRASGGAGLSAGLVAGLLIGAVEAFAIGRGGLGEEAQVYWYAPLAYAVVLGLLGLAGGLAVGVLPLDRDEIRGWTPSLALIALFVPVSLFIALFRVRRDLYLEQMPPAWVLLSLLGAAAAVALVLFLLGPRLFRGRAGGAFRPLTALVLLAAVAGGGFLLSRVGASARRIAPAPPPVPAALRDRPNLILIMVDTLRADHLSCYGHATIGTPEICRLAEDGGTRYRAFSHASWTKPAAATLLTSLLPSAHGTMTKPAALSDGAVLVSEAVKAAGYATGAVVSNINLAPSFGFDQGWDEYTYLAPDYIAGAEESSSKLILYQIARRAWFRVKPGLRVSDFYRDSRAVNARAFEWLERHRDSRFFLFLHYMDPHDPYFAHPYDGHGIDRATNQHPDPSWAEEMHQLYEGEIEYLDAGIGELAAKLRELDLYDDALIVLTSDHGEEFFEHGGWWHGLTLYEDQIHVPLLVKWPRSARLAPPVVDGRIARLIDVAPTIVARSGADVPASMQGADLVGIMQRSAERDRIHFAEEDHEGNVLRAVRTERWKWIGANPGNPRGLAEQELFAIDVDPNERDDRFAEHGDVADRLRGQAERQEEYARSEAVGEGETAEISREECERLAVLGYADMEDCRRMN